MGGLNAASTELRVEAALKVHSYHGRFINAAKEIKWSLLLCCPLSRISHNPRSTFPLTLEDINNLFVCDLYVGFGHEHENKT